MRASLAAFALACLPACASLGPLVPQDPDGFRPVPRRDDGFDWLRLTSDEWLKGELEVFRKDRLTFDSDELDTLEFDLEDVAELYSPRLQTVRFVSGETRVGTLRIDGDTVLVGDERFTRGAILSILPGDRATTALWSGKVSLGATFRSGNTDQADYNASANLRLELPSLRWNTDYNGVASEVNGTTTAENAQLTSRLDWYLTNRLFLTPAGIDVFRDPFQNIEIRYTPFASVGYDVVATKDVEWSVSLGPAFQRTEFDSAAPGNPEVEEDAAALFDTRLEWDITKDLELGIRYSLRVPVPEGHRYNSNLNTTLSVDLVGDLDLDLQFVWNRVNDPPPDDEGVPPETDDYRVVFGLGWDF